ncbi:MAG: hypothetical protein CL666_08585 [Balneola sp.]|nr:hypothetical protein [Balneola sp.]|tara:strand:+ start:27752 stop:28222 length:471 start_codon:yes stop_codon:yes gene_type:complete
MRNLSADAVQDMLAAQTGEVYLHIVKISHASLASDLLFVDNNEDIVRSDGTYKASAFRIQLPSEDDEVPQVRIQIDNVDQSIIAALRPLQNAPDLTISVIRASDPDTVEVGPYEMVLKQFDYDKFTITGTIGYQEDFLNEQFPKDQFTPQNTPGIF